MDHYGHNPEAMQQQAITYGDPVWGASMAQQQAYQTIPIYSASENPVYNLQPPMQAAQQTYQAPPMYTVNHRQVQAPAPMQQPQMQMEPRMQNHLQVIQPAFQQQVPMHVQPQPGMHSQIPMQMQPQPAMQSQFTHMQVQHQPVMHRQVSMHVQHHQFATQPQGPMHVQPQIGLPQVPVQVQPPVGYYHPPVFAAPAPPSIMCPTHSHAVPAMGPGRHAPALNFGPAYQALDSIGDPSPARIQGSAKKGATPRARSSIGTLRVHASGGGSTPRTLRFEGFENPGMETPPSRDFKVRFASLHIPKKRTRTAVPNPADGLESSEESSSEEGTSSRSASYEFQFEAPSESSSRSASGGAMPDDTQIPDHISMPSVTSLGSLGSPPMPDYIAQQRGNDDLFDWLSEPQQRQFVARRSVTTTGVVSSSRYAARVSDAGDNESTKSDNKMKDTGSKTATEDGYTSGSSVALDDPFIDLFRTKDASKVKDISKVKDLTKVKDATEADIEAMRNCTGPVMSVPYGKRILTSWWDINKNGITMRRHDRWTA